MSRPRKRPAPVAGALPLGIGDWDELQRRAEHVAKLWHEAAPSVPQPSPQQLDDLALHITTCAALAGDPEKDPLDADARAAIKVLLRWCRYDPNDNGLPHIVFRDRRLAALEAALLGAQRLAEAPPSRAWVNRAWYLWGRVAAIVASQGGEPAGHSASSHAVRFTALALQWVGHPAATAAAISMELRGKPDYRRRVAGV